MNGIPDITNLTVAQLNDLIELAEKQKRLIEKDEKRRVKQELENLASQYGYSLNELISEKAKTAIKPKSPAKYANPENAAQTWSGKGRKPQWVNEHLDAGGDLSDLSIENQRSVDMA